MASLKLGELLVQSRLLTEEQLQTALSEQQRSGGKLGETLVRLGLVTEAALVEVLARQVELPAIDPATVREVPAGLRACVPLKLARELAVLPIALRDEGRALAVAMADPHNPRHLEQLRTLTRCRIVPYMAGRLGILAALERLYAPPAADAAALAAALRQSGAGLEVLAELLVEKGLLTREELLARLTSRTVS